MKERYYTDTQFFSNTGSSSEKPSENSLPEVAFKHRMKLYFTVQKRQNC